MSNKIEDSQSSFSKFLIYKFDPDSLKKSNEQDNINYNNKEKILAKELKENKDIKIINENNSTQESNNITPYQKILNKMEGDNYSDDDQNTNVNSLILNSIQSKLERNNNDINLIRAASSIPIRFKEAFEGILKTNRIEDYDPTQNFLKIQEKYSINNRFTDTKFKPNNNSIYYTQNFKYWLISQGKGSYNNEIVWKRAKDLCKNPQFAIDETNNCVLSVYDKINEKNYRNYFHTTDLDQGSLGNCWFISAATGIIQNFNLFKRVVPFDNSFDNSIYTGAFHFRFWIYGTWKDVVIDDYLPVGPDDKLIFCKNRDTKNEFWCALLEKAYAKICGSYEALEGGFTTDALIDMSGGIEEICNLINLRKTLYSSRILTQGEQPTLDHNIFWNILIEARKKYSVIGCNIEQKNYYKEVKLTSGLVQGHAYIITKVAEIERRDKVYRLLRLYNPWGNDVEWNGDWSDKSSLWNLFDRETKERLELKIENDGEFWMSYEDWIRNFDNCQICNLTPDTINDISENDWQNSRLLSNIFSMWQCQMFHGNWIKGLSAGGRGEYDEAKYWTNPQYTFQINETDVIQNDCCWVIIGLMQKFTRQKRVELKSESTEEYIQFRLYKVKDLAVFNECIYTGEPIKPPNLHRVNSSGAYTNKREVSSRFSLKPGAYVIVPSCFDEDVEGEFLIRIFTEKPLSKKNCQTLITPNIRKTIQNRKKIDTFDIEKELISKEIQSLSFGASNVFHKFIHIASDFSKLSAKNENNVTFGNQETSVNEQDLNDNRLNINLGPRISCNQS